MGIEYHTPKDDEETFGVKEKPQWMKKNSLTADEIVPELDDKNPRNLNHHSFMR